MLAEWSGNVLSGDAKPEIPNPAEQKDPGTSLLFGKLLPGLQQKLLL